MNISEDNLNLKRHIQLTLRPEDAELNCLDELVKYVHAIVLEYRAPFTLMVSGGIDSQAMLYVWKKSGVNFKACHVDYLGFNSHDLKETQEFCSRECIPLEIIKFDLINFLERNLEFYALTYSCASPQICTYMAMSELIAGTKIFSGNLPTLETISLDNTIFGLQRYAKLSTNSVVPFFLHGTELSSRAALANAVKRTSTLKAYSDKCAHYERLGMPVIRQEQKLTGFEQIKSYYDTQSERVTPELRLMHSHLPSKRVFDHLFRNKYLVKIDNHFTPYYQIIQNVLS